MDGWMDGWMHVRGRATVALQPVTLGRVCFHAGVFMTRLDGIRCSSAPRVHAAPKKGISVVATTGHSRPFFASPDASASCLAGASVLPRGLILRVRLAKRLEKQDPGSSPDAAWACAAAQATTHAERRAAVAEAATEEARTALDGLRGDFEALQGEGRLSGASGGGVMRCMVRRRLNASGRGGGF
eukprot:362536-Chlamydomonas_euryale.AAC.12